MRKIQLGPSFLARATFWSNFVPALNCSRTQPIAPTGGETHSRAILNLNLLFGCNACQQQQQQQQQPCMVQQTQVGRRAQEVLGLLAARALERPPTTTPASHSSEQPPSSRMANISQSTRADELHAASPVHSNTTRVGQDQKTNEGSRRARFGRLEAFILVSAIVFTVAVAFSAYLVVVKYGCRKKQDADEEPTETNQQVQAELVAEQQQQLGQIEDEQQNRVVTLDESSQNQLDQAQVYLNSALWLDNQMEVADKEPTQQLCRSHSQSLLANGTGEPIMVPILTNSIGRQQAAGGHRRRRVQISEPGELFCPVHQAQAFFLNQPESEQHEQQQQQQHFWSQQDQHNNIHRHQRQQVELQAYQDQRLANYANQLHRLG